MGNETHDGSKAPEPVLVASLRRPTPNATVHALPCTIAHDGPASIHTYFMPRKVGGKDDGALTDAKKAKAAENDNDKMQEEDTQSDKGGEDGQLYEAQFRGRFLKGVRTSCPKGTVGFVVRESPLPAELVDKAPSTANNRYWSIDSEFRDLTLWHHDFPPPLDHCLHQVEEWCTLAKAIHEDTD